MASPASARPAPPRPDEYRPDPDRWKALAVVSPPGSCGDYASSFRHGIVSIAAFVAAALALVLADVFTRDS